MSVRASERATSRRKNSRVPSRADHTRCERVWPERWLLGAGALGVHSVVDDARRSRSHISDPLLHRNAHDANAPSVIGGQKQWKRVSPWLLQFAMNPKATRHWSHCARRAGGRLDDIGAIMRARRDLKRCCGLSVYRMMMSVTFTAPFARIAFLHGRGPRHSSRHVCRVLGSGRRTDEKIGCGARVTLCAPFIRHENDGTGGTTAFSRRYGATTGWCKARAGSL